MVRNTANSARLLSPEDIGVGDFVAMFSMTYQFPSYLWGVDCMVRTSSTPVNVEYFPSDPGVIWRVKSVCIPFVFGLAFDGSLKVLDVRQCKLARIPKTIAHRVWKRLKHEPHIPIQEPCRAT